MSALLDTGQIAAMLGVTRAHVTDNLTKRPDFPAPVVNVSQKLRRWKESDIRQWLAREAREDDVVLALTGNLEARRVKRLGVKWPRRPER